MPFSVRVPLPAFTRPFEPPRVAMVTVGEVPLTEMVVAFPARTSGVVMLTLPAVDSTPMAVARLPLIVRMPVPPIETHIPFVDNF